MKKNKKVASTDEYLKDVVNQSMNETIKMSLFSSVTTLIPVIVLLALGSHSIFTFMFAMLIGLIAGTFSSIFIATKVWRFFYKNHTKNSKKKKKKEYKEELDEYTFTGINA